MKKKILIADDEPHIITSLQFTFRNDFTTVTAVNGQEALEKIEKENPDLIILDGRMPKMTGFEVCRSVKNNEATKSIPIIILTAHGQESDFEHGKEVGADEYMTKPFSPRKLVARVKEMVGLEDAAQ